MPQFANLSDDELATRIVHNAGPLQQAMIAESQRRLVVKEGEHLSNVQSQISELRKDIAILQTRLVETHRVRRWILLFAIVTAILAFIAACDVILRWIRGH